jgi:acyl carrier protein
MKEISQVLLQLREMMSEVFECSAAEITDEAAINAVSGWDSLNHVKLMMQLNEAGVPVSPNDIADLTSFRAIKEFIERAGGTVHG